MKFSKAALAALIMVMLTDSGQTASVATATLVINVNFTQPSCNIQAPSLYSLGLLTPGEKGKEHAPLKITRTCEGNMLQKTALTAEIRSGTAENDHRKVRLKAGTGNSRAALSLKEEKTNSLIKMTGSASGEYFCSNTAEFSSVCTLIPVTEVSEQGALGPASALLLFEVVYS